VTAAERRPPRLRLALFGVALALLVVAATEALLRAAGVGEEEPLWTVATDDGPRVVRAPSDGARATAVALARAADRLSCAPQKPAGSVRVVVVGESTVAGFPFQGKLSFARLVERALREAGLPQVEVVNFGRAADSSDDVRATAIAALRLDPDVLVVSSGHNDFQASYLEALRDDEWSRARAALRGLALVRAGSRRDWRAQAAEGQRPEPVAVADLPFLDESERARGVQRYRANLQAIAGAARAAGVALVAMTSVANLDCEPCASHFSRPLDAAQRDAFRLELATLEAAFPTASRSDLYVLTARAAALLELDSGVARLTFLYARLVEAAGERLLAHLYYVRALAADGYPNRAGLLLNGVVRELCADGSCHLAAVDGEFDAVRWGPDPRPLFLDYCHPNLDGVALLARTLLPTLHEALARQGHPFDLARATTWLEQPADRWLAALGLDRAELGSGLVAVGTGLLQVWEATPTSREPLTLALRAFEQALDVDANHPLAAAGRVALLVALERVDEALAAADKLWRSDPEALQKLEQALPGFPNLADRFRAQGVRIEGGRLSRAP